MAEFNLGEITPEVVSNIIKNEKTKKEKDSEKEEKEKQKSCSITCEECFSIPKIIFLKKDKVKIECQKCKSTNIKDISYFDKFFKKLEENIFIDLPKCSFNKKHKCKSEKYCFQCTKYLCEECIKIHNISFSGKNHILIGQKMENQYYCDKEDHSEYINNRFCTI